MNIFCLDHEVVTIGQRARLKSHSGAAAPSQT
jgi:hypothetical protein